MNLGKCCFMDLEPELDCPEEYAWVIENIINGTWVKVCDDHKEHTISLVDPQVLRVWPREVWEKSEKDDPFTSGSVHYVKFLHGNKVK